VISFIEAATKYQGGIAMLGKLTKVNIRDVWKNEATDFTKWLARQENLSVLGEEIGIVFR
jgi:hypothetical protein